MGSSKPTTTPRESLPGATPAVRMADEHGLDAQPFLLRQESHDAKDYLHALIHAGHLVRQDGSLGVCRDCGQDLEARRDV